MSLPLCRRTTTGNHRVFFGRQNAGRRSREEQAAIVGCASIGIRTVNETFASMLAPDELVVVTGCNEDVAVPMNGGVKVRKRRASCRCDGKWSHGAFPSIAAYSQHLLLFLKLKPDHGRQSENEGSFRLGRERVQAKETAAGPMGREGHLPHSTASAHGLQLLRQPSSCQGQRKRRVRPGW